MDFSREKSINFLSLFGLVYLNFAVSTMRWKLAR